jgi:hypothetical protein
VITIGGVNGITLAAGTPLNVGGDADFTGDFSCVNASISGATLSGAIAVQGALSVASVGSFTVAGSSTAGLFCSTTIGSTGKTCTVNGALNATGNVSLGTTPSSAGNATTLLGDLVSAGNGARVALSFIDLADADTSLGYYHRYLYTNLTANRNLYLTIADPRTGTEFFVHNQDAGNLVIVYIGGVFVCNVPAASTVMCIKGDSSWFSVAM